MQQVVCCFHLAVIGRQLRTSYYWHGQENKSDVAVKIKKIIIIIKHLNLTWPHWASGRLNGVIWGPLSFHVENQELGDGTRLANQGRLCGIRGGLVCA